MQPLDWILVVSLLCGLIIYAIYTRTLSTSVTDFLAANRCGGRYMISVSNGMAGLCIISMMYFFQISYDTGFVSNWWLILNGPAMIIIAITGWVIFRFRQTRAMTLPEFFEMRYSRGFRVFAGLVAFTSGILNFGIFPSVGARFLIFYGGLPESFTICGLPIEIPTFPAIMALLLIVSVAFTFIGGQITIMFTDFIQGTLTTLIFAFVVAYLLMNFSKSQMSETLLTASSGNSLVNPYDIGSEQNFNLSYYLIAVFMSFYGILCWQGSAGYNCCAKSAHEAKMAYMLAPWKQIAILPVICVLVPISVRIYTQHESYAEQANYVNSVIAEKISSELSDYAEADSYRGQDLKALASLTLEQSDKLLSIHSKPVNLINDEDFKGLPVLKGKTPEQAKQITQLYFDRTDELRSQMRLPLVFGRLMPRGLMGLFFAAMLMAFISTHNTYIHSWGSMFVQDVVLPFRKKPISEVAHIRLLKIIIIAVAVYVFFFSLYFKHSQRILMYCQITASIFVGGAGAVIIGGLYWRKGTNQAAWAAMTSGLVLSVCGIFITQSGISAIDGALDRPFWVMFNSGLSKIGFSDTFWSMARFIFGLNSQVILFFTSCICLVTYIVVSLITSKEDFNMDKLLHRGKYAIDGEKCYSILDAKTILNRLGFSQDFTKGDYIIAASSIIWPLAWFVVLIAGTFMRDKISDSMWFEYWYYWMWGMFYIGIVLTGWFTIGGVKDLVWAMKYLRGKNKENN